ncbi:MAG TPA: hypothetical protein VF975_06490 [Thermoanaerobaculia bacterium]
MKRIFMLGPSIYILTAIVAAQSGAPGQAGALSGKAEKLQSEVLITTLATTDLTKQITDVNGKIEHKSEVSRGGPVAAVVRVPGCEKDSGGNCKVNADIVVYKPDGSVFHEAKNLDLPQGRAAVPLKFSADATTGVYRVVATIRDLTARRFATVERQFGVK